MMELSLKSCQTLSIKGKKFLRGSNKTFPTAIIISGRSLETVRRFVNLKSVHFAGSHGMDIELPGAPIELKKNPPMIIEICRFVPLDGLNYDGSHSMDLELPSAPEKLKKIPLMIAQVERTLKEKLKTIEGKKLENNKFSPSIHYRHVKEDKYKDVASCVLATVRD